MDVQFLTDPKIEALGEQFGAVGPLTMISLFSAAKTQGNNGHVRNSYRITATSVFSTPGKVKRVIGGAGELGLVDVENLGERGFAVALPGWHRWQEAHRKREERASEKRPKTSENVQKRTPTGTGT